MCGNFLPHCHVVQGVRTTRRHNVRKGFFYNASRRSMEIARSFELCNDNEILLLRCCCAASALLQLLCCFCRVVILRVTSTLPWLNY